MAACGHLGSPAKGLRAASHNIVERGWTLGSVPAAATGQGSKLTRLRNDAAIVSRLDSMSGPGAGEPTRTRTLEECAPMPEIADQTPDGAWQTTRGGLRVPLFGPPNIEKLREGTDTQGLLKALVYQRHWRVRRDAAEALGQIGDPGAVVALIDALRDDNSSVRQAAAEALGRIGDASAVAPLLVSLKDPSSGVRCAAARALGQIGDRLAVDPLIVALADSSWSVRESVAVALGHIPDPRAAESLEVALGDPELNVRQAAAGALAALASAVD
jgi:hypothetical protein